MTKALRIGIIGTGVGLTQLAPGFMKAGAQIVAVCGSSLERTDSHVDFSVIKKNPSVAQSEVEDLFITDDYKKVCDSNNVDLICVTTPNEFHMEHMAYALKTNKHIFLEKPVGMTADETRELAKLDVNKDRMVVVSHQLRFNPYFEKMREIIASGSLGRIYNISIGQYVSSWTNLDRQWSWSYDVKKYGGRRLALGVHIVDLARFLLDAEPTSISAVLDPVHKFRTPGGEEARETLASDFLNAQITFPQTLVTLETSASTQTKEIFDIVVRGEDGELTFDLKDKLLLPNLNTEPTRILDNADAQYDELKGASIFWDSFVYYAKAVTDTLQAGESVLARASNLRDAINNMTVLDAMLKSHQSGTRELLVPWRAGDYS